MMMIKWKTDGRSGDLLSSSIAAADAAAVPHLHALRMFSWLHVRRIIGCPGAVVP
jgi:hypothetical protein